jgi:glucosyl-3-phosphoglycerate synthase
MARPLLSAFRPELSGVIQPLSGEYAGTRDLLESVPFAAGYGVEIGLLLDAHSMLGLAGLAQVNLGVREHRNRELPELGLMARQILGTVLARCGVEAAAGELTQFLQVAGEWLPDTTSVPAQDRPPMRELLVSRGSAA